ncbi:hypothetical protein SARC_02629 [Sphaeroforma arctica JP610]|uniref:AB hydrolase-1 domain-containing protein n=1 Tax=Sphaeroforma arctica JP610 TaxID=667725 RepID=A0A0L0G818_9EUKA|nr:hypothetical protein SARC_02629 [Sphaeroforma arctica JP610]KNC85172.1 hypothetical protein SARC_02629 [Sphaeroforma arctica JP610]|eukprot:XP_014159074.1 hypothetical protein SARC_02629 [Sphaeroforma arctica JP610]
MNGSISRAIPGLLLRSYTFRVPLCHRDPNRGPEITLFAREMVDVEKDSSDLPVLCYLNGGPGFQNMRPASRKQAWFDTVLKTHRVILIDQRGTGKSSAITPAVLQSLGSAQAQADYVQHFRQTDIVSDCEVVRRRLFGDDRKWTLYGQSFGGWISLSYLSFAPEGLHSLLLTGGLAPIGKSIEEVYTSTFKTCLTKNNRYYRMYPEDIAIARKVADYLAANVVCLPDGNRLTVGLFQTFGFKFISHHAHAFPSLHYILEDAFDTTGTLTPAFIKALYTHVPFDANPMYALVHELIYADGNGATNWAASRVQKQSDDFNYTPDQSERLNFTTEMVFPWMFDTIAQLQPYKECAQLLSQKTDWQPLYDAQVLADNTVPIAAAVYYEDVAVDRELSLNTAQYVGNTKVCVVMCCVM